MGIRTFIAIEIPEPLRKEFSQLQNELKKSDADVKWVDPKNMHLTLKFLGNTEEKELREIKEVLEKNIQDTNPFEINFFRLGAFPKLDFPRVIWVGIEKGKENLTLLAEKIEKCLVQRGFPKEKKPYSCHLTLGRLRSFKNKDKLKKIFEERINFRTENNLIVDKIFLFKSELTSLGPIYTKLVEFPFS
ncbi:MAG: RNA 2',3'-cyclic phosphodiesterase [Candidatus Omnitrophica bacterium]|nr:RNA 2',3'-cyclic phosphodiesterase [Candidatus Omnitrophota bacterium]